jgi:hypothetical protein
VADDSFTVAGSGSLSANCASTVGGASVNERVVLSNCNAVREYAPAARDPYKDVAAPTIPSTCNSNNKNWGNPSTAVTISPSSTLVSGMRVFRFCNGLTLKGQVHFDPGLYIISGGDLSANAGAQITGSDVTFFITSPNKADLNGHAQLNLSAPTDLALPLHGIVFFGSRSASGIVHKINGTAGSVIKGAMYAPTTGLDYTGNSNAGGGGGCTQIIANTVTFSGNSGMASSCAGAGTLDLKVNESVSVIE